MTSPDRPHRHLCPEADLRDAMDDGEFWGHVADSLRPGGTSAFDPNDQSHYGHPGDIEVALTSNPCPECGATGACDFDAEGRPMIHTTGADDA